MEPQQAGGAPKPPPGLLAVVDSHMVDAFNACADALDFLKVVDKALAGADGIPNAEAVCTVLSHVAGLVERARDAAEWARKGVPHA